MRRTLITVSMCFTHIFANNVNTGQTVTHSTNKNVISAIANMRLEHADIVYAQAILESNNFTSSVFVENNNMFGMKYPTRRQTVAVCSSNGYAKYNTWEQCIIDYALYQSLYFHNLTGEEYLNKLSSVYAEDSNYKHKLIQILKQYGNKNKAKK